ncbi:hypothetical protein [Edwardsiella tarda]|uniref:hypothetical protein n=1 Tax=Edwardsiella TaxID=635 RepID=UPI00351C00D5
MYTSDAVYLSFKNALYNKLFSIDISDFESAWGNGLSNKTRFVEKLFSSLASDMSLFIEYEKFRCDMTLLDEDGIPLVFIESENNHSTAVTEVEQLCCLHAPLKVLVISCSWFDTERERWLPIWSSIIKKYSEAYPTNSKFSIIIGEWGRGVPCDDILRYYMVTLSSLGEVIDDVEWVLQKS